MTMNVGDDFLTRVETILEMQALTEQGSVMIGKYAQSYEKDVETLEVSEAYTLKPDGRKIPVSQEGMQLQSGVASPGAGASMPNTQVLQVTFPNVQKRDRVVLRLVRNMLVLPLDGWYSTGTYFPPTLEYESVRVRIVAPPQFAVRLGGSAFESKREEVGGKVEWTIEGSTGAKVMDAQAIDVLRVWPYIVASSFLTHEEVVRAYSAKSNAKAIVSEDVKKLAETITEGLDDPRAKARALFDWVRHNIRYVAVYLGVGGWVPHDVDWILKNRYGDCKDQALLLQVLLESAGVKAVPVLINSDTHYTLPALPAVGVSFNHAILYIPQWNLFVDPTAANTPFGELPWQDQDKPVAVALNEGAKLMRTPAGTADANVVSSNAVWKIATNGNATVDLKINATGLAATEMQDRLQQIPGGMGSVAVQKVIEESGFKGRGFVQYPKVQRDVLQQTVAMQLELRDVLADRDAGTINPNPFLSALPIYVRSQYNYATVAREYAIPCTPFTVHEEFELIFDPAFKVARVPSNLELENESGVHFNARYKLEGQTLKGSRTLVTSLEGNICSPEIYAKRKPTFDLITQHLRSSVLYQQ